MAEYIEREPMIEEMQRLIDNVSRNFPKATETELIILKGKYEAFMEYIKEQPTADVQPVRRGKWVYYKNNGIWDIHKCTVCNTPFELPMDVVASSVFCYCPHCGADLRGEDNG